jgi:hypothetical protein
MTDSPQSTVLIYFHTQCRLICHEAILIAINKLLVEGELREKVEQYDIYHCIIACLGCADLGVACELFGNLPTFFYIPPQFRSIVDSSHIAMETMTAYVTISLTQP